MVNFYKPKAKNENINKVVTVKIERLDINGHGVAKVNNKPIFVERALEGELVEVKIIEQKSKFMRGKALKILTPSSHRVLPACKHFYQCGGCDLQHMDYQQQLAYKTDKVTALFERNANISQLPWQPVLVSQPWQYRRKARIGVQYNKNKQAIIGFRQRQTNVLTHVDHCAVLSHEFADQFSDFTQLINSFDSKEAIGHIEVISGQQPRAVFRVIRKLSEQDKQKLAEFEQGKCYQVCLQTDHGIVALDGEPPSLMSYRALDCELQFKETDFVQVNSDLNVEMIKQAIDWLALSAKDKVLDLFCGLGNFSIPMAKAVEQLTGVEGVQHMVDRATANATYNQLTNCQFLQANLDNVDDDWSWLTTKIDKVLLDPARAGALNAVHKIIELNIETVLYISCDAATMTRDAKVLLTHGYQLKKLGLMDMFSQTRHVETMALFSK